MACVKGLVVDDGDAIISRAYSFTGVRAIDSGHANRIGGKDYALHDYARRYRRWQANQNKITNCGTSHRHISCACAVPCKRPERYGGSSG